MHLQLHPSWYLFDVDGPAPLRLLTDDGRVDQSLIVPTGFEPHVHTLLEEAPVSLLAKVVEQLHAEAGVAREEVWASMRSLARELQGMRALWLE